MFCLMLHRSQCQCHDFILCLIDSYQLAILHLQDAIDELAHSQVVRDDDAGAVVFMDKMRKGFHHLEGAFGVERGGRFVEL